MFFEIYLTVGDVLATPRDTQDTLPRSLANKMIDYKEQGIHLPPEPPIGGSFQLASYILH